ncbi:MAG: hypothetical protein ACM3OO_10145 [Planctomycetaceae bacterium]
MDRTVVQMSEIEGAAKGAGRQDPNLAPEVAVEQDMERQREEAEIQRRLRDARADGPDAAPRRPWWRFWKR